ncbi:MAG: hypothetical protein CL843_15760 [Crocinitomicaceae bacterium]|nr:hypothetical protein [Crocinitomicaceae bacterium]
MEHLIIKHVHKLVMTNLEAAKELKVAEAHFIDQKLIVFFGKLAGYHENNAEQLKQWLSEHKAPKASENSGIGFMERILMDFQINFALDEERKAVKSCEKVVKHVLSIYQKALSTSNDETLTALLVEQEQQVAESLQTLEDFIALLA